MIIRIQKTDRVWLNAAAELLKDTWPVNYQTLDKAFNELCDVSTNVLFGYIKQGMLVGVVGAIAQYLKTGWELHPLVVKKPHQNQGIGRALLYHLEAHIKEEGGLIIYLGTDDESYQTSLSDDVDLFVDPFYHIEHIKNYAHHPFTFYEKHGYKIVGVLPDVNGFRKPDIWMAKRLVPRERLKTL